MTSLIARPAVRGHAALVAVALAIVPQLDAAENWPQWRGPDGDGVAADGDYPIEFSNEESVAWKVKLPGLGTSTPAVWNDLVFVTCEIDGQDGVVCYDFAGKEQWRKTLGPGKKGKSPHGSGANPSPVTDGQRVVVYYKSGTIAALDFAGKVLWKHNLQEKYGEDTLWWDLGTSPALVDGKAVVAVMQEGPSYLVAFDLSSGDVAWHVSRQYKRPPEADQAYTTPSLAEVDGKTQLIVFGADHLTGHDPASGEKLWQSGGFNPEEQGYWRVIASQAIGATADGEMMAVVPFARGKSLAGVRLGGQGDVTESNRVWTKSNLGADVPTPIVRDGAVLLLSDRGEVTKLDLATGEVEWSDRLPRGRDNYYASPVLAGDTLYCAREDGKIFVAKVGDGLELLAENDMGEQLDATPIPIRNGLLIRGAEHLYRIE